MAKRKPLILSEFAAIGTADTTPMTSPPQDAKAAAETPRSHSRANGRIVVGGLGIAKALAVKIKHIVQVWQA
jgi:hypothetical protein